MTKRKNILQKFQNFIHRLTPEEIKQLHTLIAAWRGPDSENENIKTKYTAKIRYAIVGEVLPLEKMLDLNNKTKYHVPTACGGFEVNPEPLTTEDNVWKDNQGSHFNGHTTWAIELLLKLQE